MSFKCHSFENEFCTCRSVLVCWMSPFLLKSTVQKRISIWWHCSLNFFTYFFKKSKNRSFGFLVHMKLCYGVFVSTLLNSVLCHCKAIVHVLDQNQTHNFNTNNFSCWLKCMMLKASLNINHTWHVMVSCVPSRTEVFISWFERLSCTRQGTSVEFKFLVHTERGTLKNVGFLFISGVVLLVFVWRILHVQYSDVGPDVKL